MLLETNELNLNSELNQNLTGTNTALLEPLNFSSNNSGGCGCGGNSTFPDPLVPVDLAQINSGSLNILGLNGTRTTWNLPTESFLSDPFGSVQGVNTEAALNEGFGTTEETVVLINDLLPSDENKVNLKDEGEEDGNNTEDQVFDKRAKPQGDDQDIDDSENDEQELAGNFENDENENENGDNGAENLEDLKEVLNDIQSYFAESIDIFKSPRDAVDICNQKYALGIIATTIAAVTTCTTQLGTRFGIYFCIGALTSLAQSLGNWAMCISDELRKEGIKIEQSPRALQALERYSEWIEEIQQYKIQLQESGSDD